MPRNDWRHYEYRAAILEEARRIVYPLDMAKHGDKRREILLFWKQFGTEAAVAAFGVSRPTLFRWQQRVEAGNLKPFGTIPKHKRRRQLDPVLVRAIIQLRTEHPRLGKEKLRPLLLGLGFVVPSVSTLGRILGDLRATKQLPNPHRLRFDARTGKFHERPRKQVYKRRKSGYVPRVPGDLVALDTVITILNGRRRYTVTAIDLTSRFAFAWTYSSGSSRSAADLLEKFRSVAPFTVRHLHTDNGSEFHKDFDQAVNKESLVHFWNYPRNPKGNAHIERFNRTIQDEFLSWRREMLATDLDQFNQETIDWLIWYNRDRPHYALHNQSPLAYLQQTKKSQMYWTHTPNLLSGI